MSAKIIFDTRDEIREDLRDKAKEVDGKFELDAQGILKKNTELLGKNTTLTDKVEELESSLTELKKSAKIPQGSEIAESEIVKLGRAAKAAEISEDEMPTLKTSKDDLQKQIDGFQNEKVIDEVLSANKLNPLFKRDAREKGLQFDKETATVDGKAVDTWFVKGDGDKKTKVEDFLKTDDFFKVADYAAGEEGTAYPSQRSDKNNQPPPKGKASERLIERQNAHLVAQK